MASTVSYTHLEGTHTIVDHNGDTVTLPRKVERIAVCDILPLPSVLAVFFDSAEKIVGMSETSMSAAKNSLLAELYPEITKAQTGFINGSEVNVEELLALNPDVVFYNATSAELGEQLKGAGFNAEMCIRDSYIVGRMGMPYPDGGVHIINVTLDAPEDAVRALSGALGRLPGVSVKATYAQAGEEGNHE